MTRSEYMLSQLEEIGAHTVELRQRKRSRMVQLAVNIEISVARIRWAMTAESFDSTDEGQQPLF